MGAVTRPSYADPEDFRAALLAAGLLHATKVDGLYHRSGVFDDLVNAVQAHVASRRIDPDARRVAFPPLLPRADWLQTDYVRSFPDLMGSVTVFTGSDKDHRVLLARLDADQEWESLLTPAELVVSSSACHSLYGTLPTDVPAEGFSHELAGFCFRHEPSLDPARMQSFRMMEFVRVGTPAQAAEHREAWVEHAQVLLRDLGLGVRVEVAHDPFFGRIGTMLAGTQEAAEVKHELVVDLTATSSTAITSVNLAESHFGAAFGLTTPDGETAHSACCGIGLERIALAVIATHGLDPEGWPDVLRTR
jgi:seryl-tRNA synthetase